MNSGARPERLKRKDFDYIRSFHPAIAYGFAQAPQFPPEYLTDKTGWLPNQNADGLPDGCTSYATTKVARIVGFVNATVQAIEGITHANELGGYSILAAIDAARTRLKWFNWRYTIQAKGPLDYFDAFRLAQTSGYPEQRAISVGSMWFPSWEKAILSGVRLMPMPTDDEIKTIKSNINAFSWHNYVLDGWSSNFDVAPGRLLYRADSWQGDKDPIYFPREVINVVFDLYGTIAVTVTANKATNTVPVSLPDWFWSFIHSVFGLSY